jgi:hypothetical protein
MYFIAKCGGRQESFLLSVRQHATGGQRHDVGDISVRLAFVGEEAFRTLSDATTRSLRGMYVGEAAPSPA